MEMKRSREHADMVFTRLFQRPDTPQTTHQDASLHSALIDTSFGSSRYLVRDSQRFHVLATSSKHTSTDCVSSTALMVYRGIGAGIAWTIGVDLYALVGASEHAWREHLATLPHPSTKRKELSRLLLKSCGRNVLLFGGFLTVFGGLTCSMEMVRGRHDMMNPFVGGFASGLVIVPKDLYKTPKYVVGGAALCGAAAMALYQFIPASSEGGGEADGRRDHANKL